MLRTVAARISPPTAATPPMKDLRQRCEDVVRSLDDRVGISIPWDLNTFLDRLEQDRGRPIELIPFTAAVPGALCGIWVGTDSLDLIYHEVATSVLHQDHIILHEIGHMVFNHRGADLADAEQVRGLLRTDSVKGHVETVLGRGAYTDVEEREAELVATLILERVFRRARVGPAQPPTSDPEIAAAQHRIAEVLGRWPARLW